KFTEKGSIKILAAPDTGENGQMQLLLQISDTGVGIPAEQLPFIFDRFFQAEGYASARKKGSGIGLSLVKLLVQLHKGQIEVESQTGRGTVFSVRIPVDKAAFALAERNEHPEGEEQDLGFRNELMPVSTQPDQKNVSKGRKD